MGFSLNNLSLAEKRCAVAQDEDGKGKITDSYKVLYEVVAILSVFQNLTPK